MNRASPRPVFEIAAEIAREWPSPSPGAAPYIEYMIGLRDGLPWEDSPESVIAYFLSNSSSWEGPVAARIKAELESIINAEA
jgi:hypothetical protein